MMLEDWNCKKKVEVNQRALVDKVLARYPEDFTVFRELLQNADDARATEVQIDFQTSDSAGHSTRANGKANGTNGTALNLNTAKLLKWVVRNNGDFFEDKDWNRLTKIADGNPDVQKIGAFGVGFYTVFSVTDRPLVVSGGKSLSIFFDVDQLYTEGSTYADSEWTSIEMDLKEDMQGPVPKPFDLARFLASTMTFMSNVKTISVLFDGLAFLKLKKSRDLPNAIALPSDMCPISKGGTMQINTVSVVPQEITVEITDRALAAGTKTPSAQHTGVENSPKNPVKCEGFWEDNSTKGEAPRAAPPSHTPVVEHPPWSIYTARYTVYSAEVLINPSDDLRKGLYAMTKKYPPDGFDFEMVYFSKEEYDAIAAQEKRDPILGSVFRGPQGLFPLLNGQYMSRVFIGQSTAQTTGIAGHLSGRFIPTVERGSIDLTNSHIAKWNEELLYVGGFLARLVYEKEIKNIRSTWPEDALTNSPAAASSKDEATYTMQSFTFNASTPDAKVSKILQDVFFTCSKSESFPIMSNSGICDTKDIRQPSASFSSFMKVMPTLILAAPGDPPSVIDSLPELYGVRTYMFEDVVSELQGRTLQDEEMAGLLRWWVDAYETVPNREKTLSELKEVAKLYIGNPKREMPLVRISEFVDSTIWMPWLQANDALPPDTIPFSFTRNLNREKITPALSWEPMTVVDWLRHLISPQVDPAHDICKNAGYSNRVVAILANIWDKLSEELKFDAQVLMEDVAWIATNQGLQRGSEAYFKEADVFRDLPVITANLSDPQVEIVLTDFGVRKHLDFAELFAKAGQSDTWSAVDMVNYLKSDPNTDDMLDEIRTHAVFPCDQGGKYCITELYLPHPDVQKLGVPVLNWPHRLDRGSEYDLLFTKLGFLRHPPLEKLIEIAGSADPTIRHAAFKYLSDKFDELYDGDYDPTKYEGMPFIPTIKDDEACVGTYEEVYKDPSWAMMGFQIVHPSVDQKIIGRLKMREAPSAKQVIEAFKDRPPNDSETAPAWFAFLATKQVLSPGDLQEIAHIPIVPVKKTAFEDGSKRVVMEQPKECFLDGSQYPEEHLYPLVFTFVDFGERANGFLKACGVKAKPDCSDIVNKIMKDPRDFLVKTNAGGGGAEKYLKELRAIAVGYEGLSEDDKKDVSKAPIFVGYHISGSPDRKQPATLGKDEFQLVKASEILIADDLENRRIFGQLVWLAPQDEPLEKLYESAGAEYLSNHIEYTVKPRELSKKDDWDRCGEVRKAIVERLPIFLHEFDEQRLKNSSLHLSWEQQSRFFVKGCKDLNVGKRLKPDYCVAHGCRDDNFEFHVSAEITTDADSVTLWLKKAENVDMYDVAVALCRLLFKTHKKHDVLSLMTILETDTDTLRRRGYDVDRIKDAHAAAVLEDEKKTKEREQLRENQSKQHGDEGRSGGHFWIRIFGFWKLGSRPRSESKPKPTSSGSKDAGKVKVNEIDQSIEEIMEDLMKGEASADEEKIRNQEHNDAGTKLKDVEYCAKLESTDLELVDVNGTAGLTRVWKQNTTNQDIPMVDLEDFAKIIHHLSQVFDLGNADNSLFNIFWHPDRPDLMGFNRNRLIFLNLAHYASKQVPLGTAYKKWYYVIVHEIAHNKTPFHDEHHELLATALGSHYLQALHDTTSAFGCGTGCPP